MAHILIFSNNPQCLAEWSHVLLSDHHVTHLASLHGDIHGDAVVFDAKKLDDDSSLMQVCADKGIRYLVIGSNWSEQQQINILLHGAAGYCEQAEVHQLLHRAVDSILKGDIWIRRSLIPKVIGMLAKQKLGNTASNTTSLSMDGLLALFATLSVREREVANMISQGESNKRIALALHISERTVKAHLSSIFRKLQVDDRLRLAIRLKEIDQHQQNLG